MLEVNILRNEKITIRKNLKTSASSHSESNIITSIIGGDRCSYAFAVNEKLEHCFSFGTKEEREKWLNNALLEKWLKEGAVEQCHGAHGKGEE